MGLRGRWHKRGALNGNRIPPAAKADRSFRAAAGDALSIIRSYGKGGAWECEPPLHRGTVQSALSSAGTRLPAAIALPLWSATRPVCRSRRAANAEQLLATCQGGEVPTDKGSGRRYCVMARWLDAAPPSATGQGR